MKALGPEPGGHRASLSRRAALVFAVLALPAVDAGAGTGTPAPAPASAHGPVLAVEDTLAIDVRQTLAEVLVTAPRVTLDEILRRVAEGEAQRDSLIDDQAYTLYIRLSGRDSAKAPLSGAEPYAESVTRVYQERPGKKRAVTLRRWSRNEGRGKHGAISVAVGSGDGSRDSTDDGKGSGVHIRMDSGMSEQFVAFAFDPEARSRFRFHIEERKIIGNQVIYRIAFTPKSPLEPLPTGRVWVNTSDFVILREEFSFADRSPLPLFMESLDSCILERDRVEGRYWVLSRVLARVTITDAARWAGKLARTPVPKVADFVIRWDGWAINQGIPDSLFVPAPDEASR